MRQLFDQSGKPVRLAGKLGVGGEGTVYDVARESTLVAKIYHRPVHAAQREKLIEMVKSAAPDLLQFAAWPVATLHNSPGGTLVGIAMPRISKSHPIHQLYGPVQRRSLYPQADWKFLVRAARNCAAAFHSLHQRGIVIGDVNQGNVLVSDSALASLIDCDSLQFKANGRVYGCEVGVPHFTPPELQGAKFDRIVRTENHDCFGLALLIFHLLFVGRHPFAGCNLERGDLPVERAIREYRFAYSRNTSVSKMTPPPYALPLDAMPLQIADYFQRAFGPGSESPAARPTAENWAQALESLEQQLRKCPDLPGHVFPANLVDCPWCKIEQAGGPNFFVAASIRAYAGNIPRLDVETIWKEIESIGFLSEVAPTPSDQDDLLTADLAPQPIPQEIEDLQFLRLLATFGIWCGGGLALVGGIFFWGFILFGLGLGAVFYAWWYAMGMMISRVWRRNSLMPQPTKSGVEDARLQRERVFQSHLKTFEASQTGLERTKSAIDSLEHSRVAAIAKLKADSYQRQFETHLESFYITEAHIPGLEAGEIAALLSNNVETALDIEQRKVANIAGLRLEAVMALQTWLGSAKASFLFDPKKAVSPSDIQQVEVQYLHQRILLERQLQSGPARLRSIIKQATDELNQMDAAITKLKANKRGLGNPFV